MLFNRPVGDLRRKVIPAIVFIAIVLFSGTSSPTSVVVHAASVSSQIRVSAAVPITQFTLTEWNVPTSSSGPAGIATDQSGKVWITENLTGKLARFDPSTNNFTEWSLPNGGSQPRNVFVKQVLVSSVNRTQVFFTEYASNIIGRFDVANNTLTEWALDSGSNPVGVFVDDTNSIYFTESGRDVIGRISPSTNNLTEWTLPGATGTAGSPLLQPWGIYVQAVSTPFNPTNRFMWFTMPLGNKIGRLEANSNRLTIWDISTLGFGAYQPTDITFGPVASIPSIIFSNVQSNRISILGNDTGGTGLSNYAEALIPSVNSGPIALAFDSSRKAIWFPEINAGNIADFNTTATITPVTLAAGYCTISPSVGSPACASPADRTSVVLAPTTSTLSLNSQIQGPARVSTVGIYQGPINGITEYRLPNKTARPNGIVLDSSGGIWFTESNVTANRIGRFGLPYAFQVSVSPTTKSVSKGQTATFTVNVGLTTGSPQPVTLSLVNEPVNVTASFNPQTQNPPFTSTLSIATTNSTPIGNYSMMVRATSGGQNKTASFTLGVGTVAPPPPPSFEYTINMTTASPVTVTQGQSASFGFEIALTSGTSKVVNLNATGLPSGATFSFSNSSAKPTFFSTLEVHTDINTPAGTYQVIVTGLSSGGAPHHPSQEPVLVVTELLRDFNLSSSKSDVVLVQSSQLDVPITVTSVGSFSSEVSFEASFSPQQPSIGVIFSPASVTPEAGGSVDAVMKIVALKNTVGTYQLTLTGKSSNPARVHQIVINVRVSPCLIATAAFGSELAPEVQFLRDFRDQRIMQTFAGSSFMQAFNAWYYSFSPAVAQYEYSHATTRAAVRVALYPLMGILHATSSVYMSLGFMPEGAALVAGLMAGSLLGLAYLGLPFLGILWIGRRKVNAKTKRTFAKSIAVTFVGLMAGFILSEFLAMSTLMMVASAGLVLIAVLAAGLMPAFELVEYAKRRI